jgi:hypothetical protein
MYSFFARVGHPDIMWTIVFIIIIIIIINVSNQQTYWRLPILYSSFFNTTGYRMWCSL